MKHRLAILVVAALTMAGGCSNESQQKPPGVNSAETKPAPPKPAVEKKMSVTQEVYGKLPDGTQIDQYTLSNPNGLKVKIINYGAIVTAVETPDCNGKIENITLYRDSLADYRELDKDDKPVTPYFAPRSAATPTASPRAASRSMARSTS